VVVTATSMRSTVEFAETTVPTNGACTSMVAEVSLAGDADLYLLPTTTYAPAGKLVAVVRTASGQPLTDPSLSVKLYGAWKTVSCAPAITQLIAMRAVVGSQAVLQLQFPASPAHKTVSRLRHPLGQGVPHRHGQAEDQGVVGRARGRPSFKDRRRRAP
jgi:hypothetical protein